MKMYVVLRKWESEPSWNVCAVAATEVIAQAEQDKQIRSGRRAQYYKAAVVHLEEGDHTWSG